MTFSFHLMTAEARAFLEKAYGDLNAYLVSKIEAEVRVQKQQDNTIMLGEPFIAELKEAPDVTTVAAATAAAGIRAASVPTASRSLRWPIPTCIWSSRSTNRARSRAR